MSVPATAGQIIRAVTDDLASDACEQLRLDSRVTVFDVDGNPLAENDDISSGNLCSRVAVPVSADGTYFLCVAVSLFNDPNLQFAYALDVSVGTPVCGDGFPDPGEQCDDGNRIDADGCSAACTLEFLCPGGQTIALHTSSTPIPIFDNQTRAGVVNVLEAGSVLSARVFIDNLTHTYDSDLIISLTSPNGTVVVLSDSAGGDGDNFVATMFDDACPEPVSSGSAPFTGCFSPQEPLAAVVGESSAGDWTLTVEDTAGLDEGAVNAWTMLLCLP